MGTIEEISDQELKDNKILSISKVKASSKFKDHCDLF
jgi:hypothetical protein